MTILEKITQKEWDSYVDQRMYSEGFTRAEREAFRAAFSAHLKDVDIEDKRPFMSQPVPGITKKELDETMMALRDPHSDLSKGLDVRLYEHPQRLDAFEKIANEALKGNKESRWF